MKPTNPAKEKWEEKFKEEFEQDKPELLKIISPIRIKSFIRQTIAEAVKEELEKVRKIDIQPHENCDCDNFDTLDYLDSRIKELNEKP